MKRSCYTPYKDKSGQWIAQVKKQGRKSKHRCQTKREALEWEAAQRTEILTPEEEKTPITSLLEWATAYLDFCKMKFVKKTYDEKVTAFRDLFAGGIDPNKPAEDLKPLELLKHFQTQAQKRSGNAANKDRKNLSAAWNWGRNYIGIPFDNPFSRVIKQGEIRQSRRVPSLAEFNRVYDVCKEPQDKRMLIVYLYSAARRAELFQLRWVDVDFINGRISLHWKKNKLGTTKNAWISLTDEAMEALREQHKMTGKGKWVFCEPGTDRPYL